MKYVRILIADDLPPVRQGLATVLELATRKDHPGILVVGFARDGNEAVEKAHSLHPDVVLMDLEMPSMDGLEATRRIKARCPACRIIILTIHECEDQRQKALQAGADAFLVKGASVESILQTISKQKE